METIKLELTETEIRSILIIIQTNLHKIASDIELSQRRGLPSYFYDLLIQEYTGLLNKCMTALGDKYSPMDRLFPDDEESDGPDDETEEVIKVEEFGYQDITSGCPNCQTRTVHTTENWARYHPLAGTGHSDDRRLAGG